MEEIFKGINEYWNGKMQVCEYRYDALSSVWRNSLKVRCMNSRIYHITAGVYFLAYFLLDRKLILTIHDIGRFKELKGIKRVLYKYVYMFIPMKIAGILTTVSEYSKSDIQKYFGRKIADKTLVIPNPVPLNFKFNNKRFNVTLPRILQVGTSDNKNLLTVIDSIIGVNCEFVIIGNLRNREIIKLKENSIIYENYYNISYEEVYRQYCLADLVVFVSLHEGFGMPVIEAQATGRPVITSRECSLEEVGGNGAHYINNPLDPVEIRKAIIRVTRDDEYRSLLIERGKENAKRFRMGIIAEQYAAVYKSIN